MAAETSCNLCLASHVVCKEDAKTGERLEYDPSRPKSAGMLGGTKIEDCPFRLAFIAVLKTTAGLGPGPESKA